jgi:hypothetical protein
MAARKPRYFRVIYYDRDQLTCNISEIISDDTAVTNRTCELQETGRNVNISTTDPQVDRKNVPSIDSLLKMLPAGYRYDQDLSW